MNLMRRIRLYHATLGILSLLAYITGDFGLIHAWLGYGVAIVILIRLLWSLGGERNVGLMRFYPSFEGLDISNVFVHPAISKTLLLGIAISLIGVTITGIAMDKGMAIGVSNVEVVSTAYADDGGNKSEEDGFLSEAHELFANGLLLFVGMHVSYLLLFKRPLAKFMLFMPPKQNDDA